MSLAAVLGSFGWSLDEVVVGLVGPNGGVLQGLSGPTGIIYSSQFCYVPTIRMHFIIMIKRANLSLRMYSFIAFFVKFMEKANILLLEMPIYCEASICAIVRLPLIF